MTSLVDPRPCHHTARRRHPHAGPRPRPGPAPPVVALSAIGLSDLLVRVADGDLEAFRALHVATAGRVLAEASRVTGDPGRAEEVAQDAWLFVWQHADRFDPSRGSAISWLVMVARGRAASWVRSEVARHARELVYHSQTEPLEADATDPTSAPVLNRTGRADVGCTLRRALAEIPERQREAIEMAFLDERTYAEVAALLDLPLGTVKSRVRTGLQRLREVL